LATIGTILKYALGRGFQNSFVPNFMKTSLGIVSKILVVFMAVVFVYVVVALIQSI